MDKVDATNHTARALTEHGLSFVAAQQPAPLTGAPAPGRNRTGEGCGAPGGTRTHDLQVRNLTLYPLSYGRTMRGGGEGGIRTLEAGYPTWRFSKPLH